MKHVPYLNAIYRLEELNHIQTYKLLSPFDMIEWNCIHYNHNENSKNGELIDSNLIISFYFILIYQIKNNLKFHMHRKNNV